MRKSKAHILTEKIELLKHELEAYQLKCSHKRATKKIIRYKGLKVCEFICPTCLLKWERWDGVKFRETAYLD